MSRLTKTEQIIELAMMFQNSYRGLSINEIKEHFECSRRSAERMKALLFDLFPEKIEEVPTPDKTKRWRFVKGTANMLISFSANDFANLEYLKGLSNDAKRKKEIELRLLKRADGIISLNAKMTEWLRSNGVKAPIENMRIWDYDNPQPVREIGEYNRTVGLAGNLDKVQFLKKIPSDINIYVYGPNKESDYPDNVKYVGNFSPDLLPLKFKESFGLVWDGDEINTCSGPLGNYLKYNDPHKLSMYLSSGIPVVIWSKAATAEFVKNVKVGILIDNLNSLNTELNNINEDEYKIMCSNAVNLSKKMRKGYFLKTALQNLIKQL